jgi:hypothetical protein
MIEKFPAFYGTLRHITVFIKPLITFKTVRNLSRVSFTYTVTKKKEL